MGEVYRFDQIGIGPKAQRLQFILLLTAGADHHQTVVPQLMQIVQYAEAILAGQADINQHDIHRMAVQLPPEGFGAARPPHLEAAIAQPASNSSSRSALSSIIASRKAIRRSPLKQPWGG